MPGHPNWVLILFHIARTSCSGLPNLPATTFHENRDSSSDLRVRSIFLSCSVGGRRTRGTSRRQRGFASAFSRGLWCGLCRTLLGRRRGCPRKFWWSWNGVRYRCLNMLVRSWEVVIHELLHEVVLLLKVR